MGEEREVVGYGLFWSLALMLLGPPTALSIVRSSDITSLQERVKVREGKEERRKRGKNKTP